MLAPSITTNTINIFSFFQALCSQSWTPLFHFTSLSGSQYLKQNTTVPQTKMKIQNEKKKSDWINMMFAN